ncbi:MAG: nucleotidyltransferase family protein [Acidimicrobiia bacterium]
MPLRPDVDVDEEALRDFCRRNGIRQLALFGSALRDDFRPDSDIDLLVEFEPGSTPGMIRLSAMERELHAMFGGRRVDLRTYGDLSRYFRDKVRSTATPLYDAVG